MVKFETVWVSSSAVYRFEDRLPSRKEIDDFGITRLKLIMIDYKPEQCDLELPEAFWHLAIREDFWNIDPLHLVEGLLYFVVPEKGENSVVELLKRNFDWFRDSWVWSYEARQLRKYPKMFRVIASNINWDRWGWVLASRWPEDLWDMIPELRDYLYRYNPQFRYAMDRRMKNEF